MIREERAVGETIEEAQEAALTSLNAPLDAEVKIEVLSFPEKKGFFGLFGGKQAEVRAFYDDGREEETKESSEAFGKKEKKSSCSSSDERERKTSAEASFRKDSSARKDAASRKDASSRNDEAEARKRRTSETDIYEGTELIEIENCPENVQRAYEYMKSLVSGIGISEISCEIRNRGNEYFFNIDSDEDYSILIGRRGETLDAVQYLTRLAGNRGGADEAFSKISVNVGNYRQKREETLKEIARRTAGKVKRYGRSIALNPMNPFERRIIHTEISLIEEVVSFSVGAENERKVVIALREGARASQQGKRYSGSRSSRPRREEREHREQSEPQPDREPRSDAAEVSLYGKIEPKS